MAVASSSTSNYPKLSNWSTESPSTSYKSSSYDTKTNNNILQNPAESKSNQQQSISVYLPIVLGITIGLIVGGIALGAVITVWLTASTTKTTTTTTTLPIVTALWNFNSNTDDQYNNYNGVSVITPTFVTGYSNLSNTALDFNGTSSEYVKIASPFLNLTYRSFTVEIWFYPTVLTSSDYGLFGQCQTPSMDLCLIYMIRNYYTYLAFYGDDQSGVTTLSINTWYHVAFVYDYSTSTQSLYLDGVLENSRSSNPYKGMTGPILIGAIDNVIKYYFTGNIDQVSLVTRAKTATEILNDATLVCYYSFDSNPYVDSGPLGLIGLAVNATTASGNGRVNNAISFTSALSYFVVGGLTRLGSPPKSYSISIWINPTSISGGTIIHISRCNYACGTNWCLAFVGLTSSGQIAIQSWNTVVTNGGYLASLTGPVLSTNVWTHVVQTFSPTNGMCLYVNGVLSNQTFPFNYYASNTPVYLYLGSFPIPACVGFNVIAVGQYYGLADELRVFSREITAAEVYALAHP